MKKILTFFAFVIGSLILIQIYLFIAALAPKVGRLEVFEFAVWAFAALILFSWIFPKNRPSPKQRLVQFINYIQPRNTKQEMYTFYAGLVEDLQFAPTRADLAGKWERVGEFLLNYNAHPEVGGLYEALFLIHSEREDQLIQFALNNKI